MPRSLNRVQLIGNLGADPELRTTGAGTSVVNLSLATSRSWKDRDGVQQEKTEWHRIVAFDKRADTLAQYTRKGSKLYVEGSLHYGSYEDKDGVTRYTTEIRVDDFMFLDSKGAETPTSAPARTARPTRTPALVPEDGEDDPFQDDLPF